MKKTALIVLMLLAVIFPLSGCDYSDGGNILDKLSSWLDNYNNNQQDGNEEDSSTTGPAVISLTYPAGRSPNVFTTGWLFAAKCTVDGEDISDQVRWSGTGSFSPDTGARSRPSFNAEGANTITLSVTVNGKDYSHTYNVNAVSSAGYACVGMIAKCPADSHGTPADPLTVQGPITTGSSQVLINGRYAARVGDKGIHASCGGSNTFEIISGDASVLINGKPAAKIGSQTRHCGGMGTIIGGG
jgi:uncharacterized Zn-binding protein involved in type VI secretion